MIIKFMFAIIITFIITGMFIAALDDFCLGVTIIGISSILGSMLLKEVL